MENENENVGDMAQENENVEVGEGEEGDGEEGDGEEGGEAHGDRQNEKDNDEELKIASNLTTTGKTIHGIYQRQNRHFRKVVTKSGLGYFYCEYPGCLNKITARY